MNDVDSVWLGLLLEGKMPATHYLLSHRFIIIGRGALIKCTNAPTEPKTSSLSSHFSYSFGQVKGQTSLSLIEARQVVEIIGHSSA